ncbi:16S rRNA (guanine(527)-N(7))-methyltransferase RsmG [Kroppenstedtia pulmonis]|uniref:Ribosomal RNA small subunit methyltransferase G n=1 Tax=Kroppenstedtia pulmonis TaxID=1380685 RepID=A0A7D3XKP3_9BACL|nr:16S rRNA (guanine(527)-N(7))-methyltransferase RsmG [Kroppenstedtia pulmonis]QKG85819.1 16S rRNA (guanine(527)-N(7))-methyltransferase RsmG [Kroppenstedtia pulmonis]
MDYGKWLQEQVKSWGMELTPEQLKQFALYYERLVQVNQKMNLTAITSEKDVYIKHFYDSLTLASQKWWGQVESVIDVGTGAGFPGVPLKIAFPRLRLVMVDSLKKRIGFLQDLTDELGLQHVETIHGRAEEVARQTRYRDQFDLATARAVARLNVLSEYCLPFVRPGGKFAAMKGPDAGTEVDEGKQAIEKLGGGSVESVHLMLPDEMGTRQIIIVSKSRSTPKRFPRKPGIPGRKPLA